MAAATGFRQRWRLADPTIYAIDVAAGEDIPGKGGPAITCSDILAINRADLAGSVAQKS